MAEIPIVNPMRRKERAVADVAWIEALLERAPYGVIAMATPEGPYAVARTFAYDPGRRAIYLHGATEGRTFEAVRTDDRVCLTVSEMGRLLPGKRAADFGVEFAGVVVFGRMVVVSDPEEARHGLQLLLDKCFPDHRPGRDYEPTSDEDLRRTAVFRIDVESWSGKEKKVAADFPGAFAYRPPE